MSSQKYIDVMALVEREIAVIRRQIPDLPEHQKMFVLGWLSCLLLIQREGRGVDGADMYISALAMWRELRP
jgi:hypothetical protein